MSDFSKPTTPRVLFHHHDKDKVYDITKSLAAAPADVKTEQQLYAKFEDLENYLRSFITNPEIDAHELEEQLEFVHAIRKSVGQVKSMSFLIGWRHVKA